MKCVVIGDLNLDHMMWSNPDPNHEYMINLMKEKIEVNGFVQLN